MRKKRLIPNKHLRRLARVVLSVLFLFAVLVLFIRSSWGQDIIVGRLTKYVSSKTKTKVQIDRLFITFSGNIFLEGLYLEDREGDTLLYSKTLEADLPLSPIVFGNRINLKSLKWDHLKANIGRRADSEDFNFRFLLDAFVTKDTTKLTKDTQPLEIEIGTIHFTDFDIVYNDDFLGLNSTLKLGKLKVEAKRTDLDLMRFELKNVAISDSKATYKQTRPLTKEEDTAAAQMPFVSVEHFRLQNVAFHYDNLSDDFRAEMTLGSFVLQLPMADLARNDFDIDGLTLENSAISILRNSQEVQPQEGILAKTEAPPFQWPDYRINANSIRLENNRFDYRMGSQEVRKKGFDVEDISLSAIGMLANDVVYESKKALLELSALSFQEKGGLRMEELAFIGQIEDKAASISNLKFKTGNSSLYGDLSIHYPSLDRLLTRPEEATVQIEIPNLRLALQDALLFRPDLTRNENFVKAAQQIFTGSIFASGKLDAVQLTKMQIDWGGQTSLAGNGQLYHLLEPDSLSFDLKDIKAFTTREDLMSFVSEEALGISVPKTMLVTATAKGSLNQMDATVLLNIPEGTAQLVGKYSNQDQLRFDARLEVDRLQLGRLLKNEQLGIISFSMDAEGSGRELHNLNAALTSDFSQLEWNGYDFSNLALNGKVTDGKGDIGLHFKDDNLNLAANTKVELDTVNSIMNFNVDLVGADLFALGITQENIKVGARLQGIFKGNAKEFYLDGLLSDGIAVYDNQQYRTGPVKLTTKIDETNTRLDIVSDFLLVALKSNASPDRVGTALRRQFKEYFETASDTSTTIDPVAATLDVSLQPIPVLTEVFFKGLQQLDSITLHANFDASARKMSAELLLPFARYSGSDLDSLTVIAKGDATDFNFTAGFAALDADPIHIKKTVFEGNLKNKELMLDFVAFDGDEKLVHVGSEMRWAKDNVQLHIDPVGLVLNKKDWTIPADNQISIGEHFLEFKNVVLGRNTQELQFSNAVSGIETTHIALVFDHFKLQTFLSLLNPDEALASGSVNGRFIVENPFEASGIVAGFNINDLGILGNPIGNLSLQATSVGLDKYDFNLSIKDGSLDLDLIGDYASAVEGASLDLDLALNKIDIKLLEQLSEGRLKNGEGNISGNVKVTGSTDSPEYQGKLQFNGTSFIVTDLNSTFKISDESLRVDNTGVYLDNFSIGDENANTLAIDGSILTEEIMNPVFDLKLTTEQFQLLNSTKADNNLFYGLASIDADIGIKGDLKLPKIDGNLRVRKITEVTYVVPESQLDVEERDGVVIFVNHDNPDAILTRVDQEETPSIFRGIDLNTVIEIANDAVFNIIIDERTGDNLQVSGDAALSLNIEPNGRIGLSGRYELDSGHYETSLYNLVKRKFEINPGSTITWQGDPTDAKLDVTAVYKVETSAEPLMSAVTSGEDISTTGKYRQVLPFLVYLNVDGELLKPELSFGLDMPEDEQGSLGGAVYSRVQQLNAQESELNKQVFSLLALNRFFPASGSDGSNGGTAAIARDNVNRVLSGELNAYSDRILGKTGFELDFDLDSFTDYQGEKPQDRTQLNINAKKKLFDERLIVSAGSVVDVEGSAQAVQEATPIIGNVSLEYLLTQDGRFRLKGFRKNEYQNVIDGQLILTGVALIFNREFNKFSTLFNPLKNKGDLKSTNGEQGKK